MIPRSYLYVPGDRIDRFEKAVAAGPDCVILDLEDGVGPDRKDLARRLVHETLASETEIETIVRVNSGDRFREDLSLVATLPGCAGVLVPKADAAAVADAVKSGARRVEALIETATGVFDARTLVASGAERLQLGEADLTAELGVDPSPGEPELTPIRSQIVLASAAAECIAPVGPVPTNFRDLDLLAQSTEHLRRLGFGARACIHPAQVPIVNDAFTPTDDEIAHAEAVVAAFDASTGGAAVGPDGRMIDEAVVRSARRTLARAQ